MFHFPCPDTIYSQAAGGEGEGPRARGKDRSGAARAQPIPGREGRPTRGGRRAVNRATHAAAARAAGQDGLAEGVQ